MISVIVPVYNVEIYVRECLNSLARQSLTGSSVSTAVAEGVSFEVLLVNDGSTDRSPQICEEYCAKYPSLFRLFSQENKGLSAARNLGLANAQGEYVCFVDSDDWVSDDFLERFLNKASEEKADIVVCDYMAHYVDGRAEVFSGVEERASDLRRKVLLGQTFACNKMFRRELFEIHNVRFPEGVCYEDLGTIPLLIAKASTLAVIHEPIYHYRIGRPGAITTFRDERILHIFIALRNLIASLPKEFFPELEWMAIKACVFRYALVAEHPNGAHFQQKLREFLTKEFPEWRKNPYLQREPGRNFRVKVKLLAWNLGCILRLAKRFF